ncbi:MAG: hypothetical protein IH867_05775, partial [Chloroflexi bacterium]|nr:hypothetical protein [Chloroflexota bacterium]
MNDYLVPKLQSVLDQLKIQDPDGWQPLARRLWADSDAGVEFIDALTENQDLSEFHDDRFHHVGNHAFPLGIFGLSNWLIWRSRSEGVESAIESLSRYVSSETFEAYEVMLLSGVRVEKSISLGAGIELAPVEAVPNIFRKKVESQGPEQDALDSRLEALENQMRLLRVQLRDQQLSAIHRPTFDAFRARVELKEVSSPLTFEQWVHNW